MRKERHHKLSPRFYGPYKILDWVGKVAYKLELPVEATVHSTFHVSQLKRFHGSRSDILPSIPIMHEEEDELEPSAIINRKLMKNGNQAETIVLILWKNHSATEATWEFLSDLKMRFPHLPLWTSEISEEGTVTGMGS